MPRSASRKSNSPRKRSAAKKKAVAKRRRSTPAKRAPATRGSALDFDADVAVETLRVADPKLGRAIDVIGEFTLGRDLRAAKSVYAVLTESIISQQLSGKAAATIFGRVCALFPGARGGPKAEQILGASDAMLRGAGLSQAKTLALRDLAERSLAGEIPTLAAARRLSDEAIIERLVAVRGIGRWTAEMFLIFRLGRPDVLPVDDFGVRKGFALAFGLREQPKPRALAAYGERWAPYRTVASWYLWRTADRG
jgi:3-methyladenine DNA glycosylase/8-oxoguanine DNA glycosylase